MPLLVVIALALVTIATVLSVMLLQAKESRDYGREQALVSCGNLPTYAASDSQLVSPAFVQASVRAARSDLLYEPLRQLVLVGNEVSFWRLSDGEQVPFGLSPSAMLAEEAILTPRWQSAWSEARLLCDDIYAQ